MRVGDFQGTHLYRIPPADKRGVQPDPKRLGRMHFPVFAPDGRRLVGFMVKLPDVMGMIKQADRFVALDAIDVVGGELVVFERRDAFDAEAAKRLGVDLDECLIWTGMDVFTVSGDKLGYCADADCHPRTGAVSAFFVTAGQTASTLLGNVELPVCYLKGYRDGAMIVDDAARGLDYSGGAAAKAAEATVKAREQVKKGARALDEHGSKAVDKGSRALGKQLGRAKGMFSAFASEYKKAAGTKRK